MNHTKMAEAIQAIIKTILKDRATANKRMADIESMQDAIRETINIDIDRLVEARTEVQTERFAQWKLNKDYEERIDDLESKISDLESQLADHVAG